MVESGLLKLTVLGTNMMKSSANYVPGEPNTVPPHVQVKLYKLVQDLDREHGFPNGLDVYYHLLAVLNKHFSQLP